MRLFMSSAFAAGAVFIFFGLTISAVPSAAQTLSIGTTSQVSASTTPSQPTASVTVLTPAAPDAADAVVETAALPPKNLSDLVLSHIDGSVVDDEGKCLAAAVYFEAKGEPLAGQLAVAQVMLNRTESGRFPRTLCGVITQRGQFSFIHNGRMPKIAEDCRAWRTALAVSAIAREQLWQPVVGRAIFFHAKRVSPHWHATQVAALGNHIFYR